MKTKSAGQADLDLNLELGRTERQARRARKLRREQETGEMEDQEGNQNQHRPEGNGNPRQQEGVQPCPRLFGDYYKPRFEQQVVQEIEAENYQIPPSMVNLIQQGSIFQGLGNEDPHEHIASFLEHCGLLKFVGIDQDSMRRMLFPFSLRGRAKEWYRSQAMAIPTFEELVQKFMAKFFSPERMDKLRQDVHQFKQMDGESFTEAWERFQDLVQKFPNLMMEDGFEVQIFYNGLAPETKMNVNASAGGSLQDKTYEEVRDLFNKIATNGCRTLRQRRTTGVLEVSPTMELEAQIAALTKKMEMVDARSMGQGYSASCGVCRGGHHTDQCPQVQENCSFVNNFQRNNQGWGNSNMQGGGLNRNQNWGGQANQNLGFQGQGSGKNNQGWRNQGWSNQGGSNQNWGNNQALAPRAENQDSNPMMKLLLEMKDESRQLNKRFEQVIDEHGKAIAEQGRTIKDIQKNLGYVTQKLNTRPQGGLPSDTVPNPKGKEPCCAITL